MSDDKPVTDWSTDFDIFDQGYTDDPGPVWRDMRQRCPIAHSERLGGAWLTSTYDDVQALIRRVPELSNRQPTVLPIPDGKDPLAEYQSDLFPPVTTDPPEHGPYRRLLLPFFTVKAVESHRPFTEQLCDRLIDGFIDHGQCDAGDDYARQISPRVIGHLLGIDPDRTDEFVDWVQNFLSFDISEEASRADYYRIIRGFFAEQVAERRANPGDDYISRLLSGEINGEPLSDKQTVGICILLLSAGIDTTWSSIGSSLLHFATHPDDRRRLVVEPDLLPNAVEEMLRLHAPVYAGRIALQDVEHGDVTIKRGERMILNLPAANRDPATFENPDEAVLDREKNRHVAFGVGIHRCVGSNLARMEMEVALGVWLRRIPEFELGDPAGVSWSRGQVRGARHVPIVF
ncbi:MAG: cytochrome P450 [Alphaproteobacteria bacterium]